MNLFSQKAKSFKKSDFSVIFFLNSGNERKRERRERRRRSETERAIFEWLKDSIFALVWSTNEDDKGPWSSSFEWVSIAKVGKKQGGLCLDKAVLLVCQNEGLRDEQETAPGEGEAG